MNWYKVINWCGDDKKLIKVLKNCLELMCCIKKIIFFGKIKGLRLNVDVCWRLMLLLKVKNVLIEDCCY